MKKQFFISTVFYFSVMSVYAQHDHSSHKNEVTSLPTHTKVNTHSSQLLTNYYSIKDALVSDDSKKASLAAEEFVKTANGIDYKVISESNIHALVQDAGGISDTKDINTQRRLFANLSTNMSSLAKAMKLTDNAVYQQYCPMKKTYWLSNEKTIKNPYYGSSMLTCGSVTETFR